MSSEIRFAPLCAVVFASGFAALVYQVLWMRELRILLGATAPAVAVTLAVFFLGLALGGRVLGRVVPRARRPLWWYAWLEVGLAGSAAACWGMLDLYGSVHASLYAFLEDSPSSMLAVKLGVAGVVLLPPAFCMGGTLPVLAEYAIRNATEFGRRSAWLYATNTAGAAAGAFAAGFVLPAMLGFRSAYASAIGISLVVAVAAAWLGRHDAPREIRAAPPAREVRLPSGVLALAFWSGLAALGLEVAWTQMFAQVLQNSVYTFASILVSFLVALAIGSAVARRLMELEVPARRLLGLVCCVSGVSIALTAPGFYSWTDGLRYLGGASGFTGYVLGVFGTVGCVTFVPTVLLGSVFPLLFRECEFHLERAGPALGDLVAVNTIGAVVGSLATGFLLLEVLGLWGTVWAFGCGYFVVGLVVTGAESVRARWLPAALGCGVLAAVFPFALPLVHLGPGTELVSLRHGKQGIVAVVDTPRARRIKVDNHYTLGGTGARVAEELQAHLPLALHGRAESVCFLGLGTGITAGGACPFPLREIVACELLGDVVTAARDHFADATRGLFDDPRVRIRVEDGRQFLKGTSATFDVIVADMFIPWRAGVGGMYTFEHFAAARERLAPGGVFAQWLAAYQVSEEEFGIIARTMLDVFPRVTLWRGGMATRRPALLLVGHSNTAPFDPVAAGETLVEVARARTGPDAEKVPLTVDALLEFYCADLTSLRERFSAYPRNDDDGAIIEYGSPRTHRAARSGEQRWLVGIALIDFLGELTSASRERGSDWVGADAHDAVDRGMARHREALDLR